jgi:hypothetical protein
LATFNVKENKVIRKIDKLSPKIEKGLLDLILWQIDTKSHHEFAKQQIKN